MSTVVVATEPVTSRRWFDRTLVDIVVVIAALVVFNLTAHFAPTPIAVAAVPVGALLLLAFARARGVQWSDLGLSNIGRGARHGPPPAVHRRDRRVRGRPEAAAREACCAPPVLTGAGTATDGRWAPPAGTGATRQRRAGRAWRDGASWHRPSCPSGGLD